MIMIKIEIIIIIIIIIIMIIIIIFIILVIMKRIMFKLKYLILCSHKFLCPIAHYKKTMDMYRCNQKLLLVYKQ